MAANTSADDAHLLIAKVDDVRVIITMLKTIHFKDTAMVFATDLGLKFTVENHQCLQANVFLQAGLFYEYVLKEQQISFKINLNVLMECLSIFGSSSISGQGSAPSLKMFYDGYGEPLVLTIEEGGIVTNCSIKTMDADMALNFDFSSLNVNNKIIMKAEGLKEGFNEIDGRSEIIEMLMSPDKPFFRMTTYTESGDNYTEVAKDSDYIDTFNCTQTRSYRYKTSLLKPSTKVLQAAQKVSIRTDNRGFLSLQFMINADGTQPSFVEYLCSPDEEISEEI